MYDKMYDAFALVFLAFTFELHLLSAGTIIGVIVISKDKCCYLHGYVNWDPMFCLYHQKIKEFVWNALDSSVKKMLLFLQGTKEY